MSIILEVFVGNINDEFTCRGFKDYLPGSDKVYIISDLWKATQR